MKYFLPFRTIYCRSLPLPLTRKIEKEEPSLSDVLEVHNFINRKKNSCQSLFDFELVNHLAWHGLTLPLGGTKIVHDVTTLMRIQR